MSNMCAQSQASNTHIHTHTKCNNQQDTHTHTPQKPTQSLLIDLAKVHKLLKALAKRHVQAWKDGGRVADGEGNLSKDHLETSGLIISIPLPLLINFPCILISALHPVLLQLMSLLPSTNRSSAPRFVSILLQALFFISYQQAHFFPQLVFNGRKCKSACAHVHKHEK